jgi:hypothetical protein
MPSAPLSSTYVEASVRALLERVQGEVSTSAQRAAGAARACEDLAAHLSRVVGPVGVRALFDRSVVLSRKEHAFLAAVPIRSPEPPWGALRACLESQAPDLALEASVALITTFVGLLGRFIGEALVERLLHELWPDAFPSSATTKEPT